MTRVGSVVAVAVAAVLVCCFADTHMEEDGSISDHSYDVVGPDTRNMDGGNLVRKRRDARRYGFLPPVFGPRYNYVGGPYSGGQHPIWPSLKYYHEYPKVDRSELNGFVGKRTLGGEIDIPSGWDFNTVPTTPPPRDVNFDEIDLSQFPFGLSGKRVKPYQEDIPLNPKLSGFAVVYVLE